MQDLELFDNKDETLIGEKGANLSGGQKIRLSFARAIYSDCDIFLLDDVLSALDVNVGQEIFQNTIIDYLKNKTRLLITNHYNLLDKCDYICYLKNGEVVRF